MDKPEQSDIEKRLKVLEACQKRWQECGETECAAIYQGAVFELKLFKAELEKCQAQCAAMREALEDIRRESIEALDGKSISGFFEKRDAKIDAAISTDAGQPLLDRLHKLEADAKSNHVIAERDLAIAKLTDCQKRLEEARVLVDALPVDRPFDWYTRRNAFLATFKDKKKRL